MEEKLLAEAAGRYAQPLLRYCHHMLCDYHEAQDAVQTVFLKAWEHRERFARGTNLSAWLYRIAYRTCLDLLRGRKRRERLEPLPPSRPDYLGEELRRALEGLTPQERGLVFGRVMEERSYDELSAIYGASPAALRKRYERARKKLAAALRPGEEELL